MDPGIENVPLNGIRRGANRLGRGQIHNCVRSFPDPFHYREIADALTPFDA